MEQIILSAIMQHVHDNQSGWVYARQVLLDIAALWLCESSHHVFVIATMS